MEQNRIEKLHAFKIILLRFGILEKHLTKDKQTYHEKILRMLERELYKKNATINMQRDKNIKKFIFFFK